MTDLGSRERAGDDARADTLTRAPGDAPPEEPIDWTGREQVVVGSYGRTGIALGDRFSWAGAAVPDLYGDGRGREAPGTYISVPVFGVSGGLMGTLCATSVEHCSLSRTQLAAMEVLAGLLGQELIADRAIAGSRVAS